MTDIVERLRKGFLMQLHQDGTETWKTPDPDSLEAADEIARLRQVCRNVYEVWAGSEGIPVPETCAEGYLLQLVEKMRDEAKEGLRCSDN